LAQRLHAIIIATNRIAHWWGFDLHFDCEHVMHHRSRTGDRRGIVSSILLATVGCGGVQHQPPKWDEQGRDAGVATGSDPAERSEAGPPSEEPPRPDVCAFARGNLGGSRDSESFEESVESARTQAAKLRVADFGERPDLAAELLRRLLLALASAPEAQATDATRICEVTQEADALLSDGGRPFQGSAQIKRGLSIVVDLLEEHAERTEVAPLRPWLDSAHRAVQSIDERGMVTFQGTEIQDAFRTTVDALTVYAQRSGRAP
jgi:hypothetical protein